MNQYIQKPTGHNILYSSKSKESNYEKLISEERKIEVPILETELKIVVV